MYSVPWYNSFAPGDLLKDRGGTPWYNTWVPGQGVDVNQPKDIYLMDSTKVEIENVPLDFGGPESFNKGVPYATYTRTTITPEYGIIDKILDLPTGIGQIINLGVNTGKEVISTGKDVLTGTRDVITKTEDTLVSLSPVLTIVGLIVLARIIFPGK